MNPLCCQELEEGGNGELLTNGVSFWDNEDVLELDSCDSCTTQNTVIDHSTVQFLKSHIAYHML